jgi:hypothetical protein
MVTELHHRRLLRGDLLWYSSDVFAVTRPARTFLEGIVAEDAEFLPLECEEEELWLMRVWRSARAIDLMKSDFELLPSGRIRQVTRYVFSEAELKGLTCFTDPRLPHILFLTDMAVVPITNSGLTGISFCQLWKSP